MTDDLRSPKRENEHEIVDAAIRFAQRVSRALRARRGRRPFEEADRVQILREAFYYTVGAVVPEGGEDPHA